MVGGTVVTLAGATLIIGLESTLVVGICFAASGMPMIAGSIARYIRQRAMEEEEARRLARELLELERG